MKNNIQSEKYEALKLKNQICFPLYAASREIIKRYRPYLDELGLTYTQYIAMMVFWEEQKVTVKDLGEKLRLDSGTLTPMLKTLETKGYVARSRSKEDERVLNVEITPAGMALRERAVDIPGKMAQCVPLNMEEAQQLYQLLQRIL